MIYSDISNKYQGKTVVFVSGNFNVIHPGHIRLLSFARSCGDILVVGLFADGSPGALLHYEDRRIALEALEAVSEVVKLDPDDLTNCLSVMRPHVVVKGKEHETLSNPERTVIESYGGHLFFSAGEQSFSSRDLIRHEIVSNLRRTTAPMPYLASHAISKAGAISRIKQFSGVRVLVVGDLILDEYIYCDPLGMSQEDPTIVVTPVETRSFIGAAGIVAGHLAGLGAEVNLVSIVGNDVSTTDAQRKISEMKVNAHFISDITRPTIVKKRFRVQNKTLLRVSHLRSHDAAQEYCDAAFRQILRLLESTDLVVFSDFNYGCLPQPLVDAVIHECELRSIPFTADSQASSQVGNVGRFVGADFISATEREARLATNDFKSGVQNVANTLLSSSKSKGLLLKLGAEGLIVVQAHQSFYTDSLPAFNNNPVDVAGAGDAMLASASLCRRCGGSIFEAAYIGSVAAALQVSRIGNTPLNMIELINALDSQL